MRSERGWLTERFAVFVPIYRRSRITGVLALKTQRSSALLVDATFLNLCSLDTRGLIVWNQYIDCSGLILLHSDPSSPVIKKSSALIPEDTRVLSLDTRGLNLITAPCWLIGARSILTLPSTTNEYAYGCTWLRPSQRYITASQME